MKSIFPTALILTISLSATGCFQTFNSSTSDPDRYGGGVTSDGSPGSERFLAAYNLLRNRCFSCHYSHSFTSYTTQVEYINNAKIIANNPEASEIYLALRGTGLTVGRQDMPQDGTLSGSELATIRDWIQQIGL